MKETGILFRPANITAILDNRKTQTRRIEKLPKDRGIWEASTFGGAGCTDSKGNPVAERPCIWNTTTGKVICCPYGMAGDRLYVKEAHYLWGRWDLDRFTKTGRQKYRFRRTQTGIRYLDNPPTKYLAVGKSTQSSKWHKRSALFMEKKDARLWLDLTDVRAEQLQDISEEDAKAEGARIPPLIYPDQPHEAYSYVENYKFIWESIHGPGSWERNDWLWALSLKQVPA